jgi:DNA-binding LacI/PurR family transcriptional regulator
MMPFQIDRHSQVSLTDQVDAGFRRAIQAGHYRVGDTLPTIEQTAGALGISANVVQTVIKRLSREGLVTARPRRGIEVCPAAQQRWQGHVLYLHWGSSASYYEAVSSETVMSQLLARQILVTPVQLSGVEAVAGFPQLSSIIHTGPVDMAILAGSAELIGVFLAENEIPFVHLADPTMSPPSRLARRILVQDLRLVQQQAVRHAVACGVHSLMIVVHEGDRGGMRGIAEAAGLSVRVLMATPLAGLRGTENVERGGLEAMALVLDSGEPLPDLIYFADDFVARGGLTALLERGIRIPADVQVISWSNRYSGPVFSRPLTRIEMDPVRDGQALVDLVMAGLNKLDRKVKEPVMIGPEFVVGGTTRSMAP